MALSIIGRNIARGSIEHNGRSVDVTLIVDGDKINIIIPDEYISKEECEEIAKKILIRLYLLLGKNVKFEEITVTRLGYASGTCNYCLAITPLTFKCKRCGGYYCAEHRLPEKHNCPSGKTEKINNRNTVRKRKTSKKREEIILCEAPCG
jgi:predicted Zn-ribbon and HTH transcriptional regulator